MHDGVGFQWLRQLTASACANSGGPVFGASSDQSMMKFVEGGESGLCSSRFERRPVQRGHRGINA